MEIVGYRSRGLQAPAELTKGMNIRVVKIASALESFIVHNSDGISCTRPAADMEEDHIESLLKLPAAAGARDVIV